MAKVKITPRYVKPVKKTKPSKASKIVRTIFIIIACAILLVATAERFWHLFNYHYKK